MTFITVIFIFVGFSLQSFGFNAVKHICSVLANFVLRMFRVEIEELKPVEKIGCQLFGLFIMVKLIIS